MTSLLSKLTKRSSMTAARRVAAPAAAGMMVMAGLTACAGRHVPVVAPGPRNAAGAEEAAGTTVPLATAPAPPAAPSSAPAAGCVHCATVPMPPELAAAIEARAGELMTRGGECAVYGAVLKDALDSGRIAIKPYMWRVRGNLASAEGESSGEMTIALDIDSLNVGVRGVDDMLHSAEHEAAHIALRIASGDEVREARVQERVAACGLKTKPQPGTAGVL